jgi:SAM-dependent methyltransferase
MTGSTAELHLVTPAPTGTGNEREYVVSLLKYPDKPVLDVGTGSCACVAGHLSYRGHRVVASESDRATLCAARRFLSQAPTAWGVRFVLDDITRSKLKSGSFFNIVCFNVLHHVSDLTAALDELARLLAREGRLIVSDYDEEETGFLVRLAHEARRRFPRVEVQARPEGRAVLLCEKN